VDERLFCGAERSGSSKRTGGRLVLNSLPLLDGWMDEWTNGVRTIEWMNQRTNEGSNHSSVRPSEGVWDVLNSYVFLPACLPACLSAR